ncbi:MAG TPA: type 4a pilus biogenesis protein PilO [Rubrobacteraceae bacterium]|nr:type 4a pilus biogenesis protein PilO [Rubrobacteraceae bacterium]
MDRTNRNILILGLLVILLVVVGYYFLILGPLLGNLSESAETRDAREAELANLQAEVAELEAVQRNAPDIERQLLEYSKRIPTQPQIETLIVQIEEIADDTGVTQLSIEPGTPGPPPGGGDYSVVPITMSFEGTYEQLQFFLENARNLSRLMTVNGVSYCLIVPLGAGEATCPIETPTTGETTTVEEVEQMLQVEIEAEVYFQPSVEPSDVPAGTAPAPPETTNAQ